MVYSGSSTQTPCPHCNADQAYLYDFTNSDERLNAALPEVLAFREKAGLAGLVGDLACVIINTEPDRLRPAVQELLNTTGYALTQSFQDARYQTCVLQYPGSADFILRSRKTDAPVFSRLNHFPKGMHLPNTRLETLVFTVKDIGHYVKVQRARGVRFDGEIQRCDHHDFVATLPSALTGTAIGVIEWKRHRGDYGDASQRAFDVDVKKPPWSHLGNIKALDHTALRVRAKHRDAAILEFIGLTNYHFDFAIYVKDMNSITNVARQAGARFAMVFTSGIHAYIDALQSGPTEKFIHNYGTRVHHMAFHAERVDDTFAALKAQGQGFLIDLIGSPEEGLKQTFSEPSVHTLLVSEYIHRYGNFEGFFTKSNVSDLTGATGKQ